MSDDSSRSRYGVLAAYACAPWQTRGRLHAEPEARERTPHQRDRDRIVHCGAFRRLQFKTQVFVYHEGDNFRTRLTHSLEVSQLARSISRALGLNEDLAEALALAHDFGHTPFGHAGEDALDTLMRPWGGFDHNDQSLRIITRLEQRYRGFDGLNLTWETVEGIAKHNGPVTGPLSPVQAVVDADYRLDLASHASAEAQVAAIADDIAYGSHDMDDGVRAGLFGLADLASVGPAGVKLAGIEANGHTFEDHRAVHELVRRLIDTLVTDLLDNTRRALDRLAPETPDDIRRAPWPVVAFSDDIRSGVADLKSFLFARMYRHERVNRMTRRARQLVTGLFERLMEEPQRLPCRWQLQSAFDDEAIRARLVADYISGMTDRFAILEHRRVFEQEG